MKLVITIDTEEDNWGDFSPTDYTLENISRIPILQEIFDKFQVKPTYLLTFPVANDDKSVSILKPILDDGRCEIGTHCHPWNTPPLEEIISDRNSMLCNLPEDLQFRKIKLLHETIVKNFSIKPVSFRSGRWGYNGSVARNLHKLGYKVDTSVISFTNWTREFGPDFSEIDPRAFRFSLDNIYNESNSGALMEVPATVGYLQRNFELSNFLLKLIKRGSIRKLRLVGILNKLNILNKVWLSPENSDSKTMIELTMQMMNNKYKLINMFFHSTSLKAGKSPYVRSENDEVRFTDCIKDFLSFTRDVGIEPVTLSDLVTLA
ncbi:MAG: polysaccharide deacetylase family protein [Thermodesulfovibrionales bacterium]